MLTEVKKTLAVLALEALVDPGSAVDSIMELAANEPLDEEDVVAVRDILQPSWDQCQHGHLMIRWWSRACPDDLSQKARQEIIISYKKSSDDVAVLADMIRAACPDVPLPEPSGHDVQPTLGSPHAQVRQVWP